MELRLKIHKFCVENGVDCFEFKLKETANTNSQFRPRQMVVVTADNKSLFYEDLYHEAPMSCALRYCPKCSGVIYETYFDDSAEMDFCSQECAIAFAADPNQALERAQPANSEMSDMKSRANSDRFPFKLHWFCVENGIGTAILSAEMQDTYEYIGWFDHEFQWGEFGYSLPNYTTDCPHCGKPIKDPFYECHIEANFCSQDCALSCLYGDKEEDQEESHEIQET